MTVIDLKAELYRQIDTMADDESFLEKVLGFVSKLTSTPVSTVTPYTMEELNSRIDRSIEDVKAGRTLTSAEVKNKLLEEYEWLR